MKIRRGEGVIVDFPYSDETGRIEPCGPGAMRDRWLEFEFCIGGRRWI